MFNPSGFHERRQNLLGCCTIQESSNVLNEIALPLTQVIRLIYLGLILRLKEFPHDPPDGVMGKAC
jgi:hypothetical protein